MTEVVWSEGETLVARAKKHVLFCLAADVGPVVDQPLGERRFLYSGVCTVAEFKELRALAEKFREKREGRV